MSKVYCKLCGHRCHCVGQGYFVSSNQCGTCICDNCSCKPMILGAPTTKKSWLGKLWERYINWLFKWD